MLPLRELYLTRSKRGVIGAVDLRMHPYESDLHGSCASLCPLRVQATIQETLWLLLAIKREAITESLKFVIQMEIAATESILEL
jgi:hypothetical protein